MPLLLLLLLLLQLVRELLGGPHFGVGHPLLCFLHSFFFVSVLA